MNVAEGRRIINEIVLRGPLFEGFTWVIEEQYPGLMGGNPSPMYLQCRYWRADTETGQYGWGGGSKRYVSPYTSKSELVLACFALLRDYLEHEAREAFTYHKQRILGPHYDVDAMVRFAEMNEVDVRDARR